MLGKKMYKVGLVVMVVLFMATSVLPVNLLVGTAKAATFAATFNVMNYGAAGNGTTLDTTAIQSAIDAANSAGGGEVYFPAGTYKTVALTLKSNVTLNLASGSKILASPVSADWSGCSMKALITATSVTYAGITGTGEINCSGPSYHAADGSRLNVTRPDKILRFTTSNNITITGVTLKDSVNWTQYYDNCDYVTLDGVIVRNPEFKKANNTDGVDLNACRYVTIKNCNFETGDDAVCLKNFNFTTPSSPQPAMHDILVQNCTLASTCNATKIGTETTGEIYNVTFDGITLNRHSGAATSGNPGDNGNIIAGISVQSNDGSAVHDITFSNYTINEVDTPMFILLQDRESKAPGSPIGSINNITFDNINVIKSYRANQVNVCTGATVGTLTFKNINNHNFETYSGSTTPPYPNGTYPDPFSYGRMPAYGLFARNVSNLIFENNVNFYNEGCIGRPERAFENVTFTGPAPAGSPIIVDDSDTSAITYSGTWSSSSDSNYYNSTKHVSNTSGSYAQMTFTGNTVRIYTRKLYTGGKFDVYIDGIYDSTVDTYSSTDTYKVKVYEKTGLSTGSHTIKLLLNGQKNASASDYWVGFDYFEYQTIITQVDDSSGTIAYGGTWSSSSDTNYYNSTKHVSNTSGSYAQMTFTGSAVRIYGRKMYTGGKFDVYIDGTYVATVDTYNTADIFKMKLYEKTGLTAGSHTIKLLLNGQKNTSSSDYWIGFDLFEYN